MILSVSRRTDIPAFYVEWLINRFESGYVLVRNPFNSNMLSKIELNKRTIDCIVFWTKNPKPLIERLDYFESYNYYFQITINPYDLKLEKGIPAKREIIESVKNLSDRIGKERIIWRYDPIFFTDVIDMAYHEKWFSYLADKLGEYIDHCVISIIDDYKKNRREFRDIGIRIPSDVEAKKLIKKLSNIGEANSIKIQMCAESFEVENIGRSKCINDELIQKITGKKVIAKEDQNQREKCNCIESVDIGEYNTCLNGCVYCYANYSEKSIIDKVKKHDPNSPLLIGNITGKEKIVVRKNKCIFDETLTLIDF